MITNLGFALEYSLGHITHAQNLKAALAEKGQNGEGISPTYVDLPYAGMTGAWTRLPGVRSNWSLRASLGAYLGLRPHAGRLDGALFHTQVTSLLSAGFMRRVPSVVSLDATPLQYDALGAFYGHTPSGNERVEEIKKRLNIRAFNAARALVTWSEWAKASLVQDYGITPDRITVIPPGIDLAVWDDRSERLRDMDAVRLLFVGGDFERKGGRTLLDAWTRLPDAARRVSRLDVVTRTWSEAEEQRVRAERGEDIAGVVVHRGVEPNSPVLRELFRQADLFVFPTRGDCLPLAVLEAMAAGLPVITTRVGALPEAVRHQETGWIVPVDDSEALAGAMMTLIQETTLRQTLGARANETARERFDAARNYQALIQVVARAGSSPASR
ncbi:MAG: glycosyltransferase family 4 protein [Armatimonadota bacterium]